MLRILWILLFMLAASQLLLRIPAVHAWLTSTDKLEGVPYRPVTEPPPDGLRFLHPID